jgi:hypothetical protein
MALVPIFVLLVCCYCLDVFDYLSEFSYGDVCVYVLDVKGTKFYIIIYVHLSEAVNEAYRVLYIKDI